MPDKVRSREELILAYAQNNNGQIKSQQGRDFVLTCFGYRATFNPTVNNDIDDTAGLGTKFSVGSRWFNVLTLQQFTCFADTAGAAVWSSGVTPGPAGPGIPVGGTEGQYAVKGAGGDYDVEWSDGPSPAAGFPAFTSWEFDYTDFQFPATTHTITLATLPAGTWLMSGFFQADVTFTTSGGVGFDMALQDTGSHGLWFAGYNGSGNQTIAQNTGALCDIGICDLQLVLNSFGGNLDALTAGHLKIWLLLSSMPGA